MEKDGSAADKGLNVTIDVGHVRKTCVDRRKELTLPADPFEKWSGHGPSRSAKVFDLGRGIGTNENQPLFFGLGRFGCVRDGRVQTGLNSFDYYKSCPACYRQYGREVWRFAYAQVGLSTQTRRVLNMG